MRNRTLIEAVGALVVLVLGIAVYAAPTATTTITVPDMHCMGCAKKMQAQLQQVPGVASIQANVPATTLTIAPQAQRAPSPKAIWEAIEKAGYKPTKLEGPNGSFTTKPAS
ncbi:MAG: heavy-metal-associated domain-containing protein [Gemmataceae bacterium]|nr:heavy-metal-associated domain-containing protein [Gemmataceae bacterium]